MPIYREKAFSLQLEWQIVLMELTSLPIALTNNV